MGHAGGDYAEILEFLRDGGRNLIMQRSFAEGGCFLIRPWRDPAAPGKRFFLGQTGRAPFPKKGRETGGAGRRKTLRTIQSKRQAVIYTSGPVPVRRKTAENHQAQAETNPGWTGKTPAEIRSKGSA